MQSCGFEMLYQESGARGHNSNTSLTDMDAAVSKRCARIPHKFLKNSQQLQARKDALDRKSVV